MKMKPRRVLLFALILIAFAISACGGQQGRGAYKDKRKFQASRAGMSRKIKVPQSDIKIVVNDRVKTWMDYFTGPSAERFERYLQRSGRYVPLMKEILREYGLPEEIINLAIVESGFTAHAYSSASATGFWQFMAPTGRHYGLRIDPYVDERSDFVKSTRAAASYLSDLYNEFGDWYLALAAYNAGEGKMRRAISMYGTKDFWLLASRKKRYLKPETKDYVPKFIAATILAKNPAKYGLHPQYHEPLEFDYAKVVSQADFEAIAKCSKSDYETIALLNPELILGVTPPNEPNYEIKVPYGKGKIFEKVFAKLPEKYRVTKKVEMTNPGYHIVKKGESAAKIARQYKVSVKDLLSTNGLKNTKHLKLKRGQKLVIPGRMQAIEKEASVEPVAKTSTAPKSQKNKYKTKRGDTLSSIAKKHGITVAELKDWNDISGNKIRAGQVLAISKAAAVVPPVAETEDAVSEAIAMSAGDDMEKDLQSLAIEEPAADESIPVATRVSKTIPQTPTASIYKVKKGDTLYAIASKNGISVAELCDINNINRKSSLKPGMSLKLKGTAVATVAKKTTLPKATRRNYKVRSGDTVWDIAKRNNVSVTDIESWNSGKNLKNLKPGDVLKLQSSGK